MFWPFTVWINCSSDLKNFANSWPSALNFKSFSWSLEQFFLTVCQNNFGNKISFFRCEWERFPSVNIGKNHRGKKSYGQFDQYLLLLHESKSIGIPLTTCWCEILPEGAFLFNYNSNSKDKWLIFLYPSYECLKNLLTSMQKIIRIKY